MIRATYDKSPCRLLILLDASSSVKDRSGNWKSVLKVARELIASLPSHVSVAVMMFAIENQLVANFGRDSGETDRS